MVMLHRERISKVMNRLVILIVLSVFLGAGCREQVDKMKCLDHLIAKNQTDKNYQEMIHSISDKILLWSSKKLKSTSGYMVENSMWRIDAILFNDDSTKIFGWILRIDKEQEKQSRPRSGMEDTLDFVDFFSGEKISGQWFYYIHNMPKKWYVRKNNNGEPYSYDQLSFFAKKEVIKGGIFKGNSCSIDSDYINRWIDRDGRDMQEWHKLFLNNIEE